MPEDEQLRRLLSQARTIAVVGAKDVPGQPVDRVGRYLGLQGYTLLPVHPKRRVVWRLEASPSLAALPDGADIVVLFRAPQYCAAHAAEVLAWKRRPVCFWMQEGIANAEARAMLEAEGVTVVEDRCIMVEHARLFGKETISEAHPAAVEIAAPVDDTAVFTCKMCGQCCTGEGGIVVSPKDLARITAALGISEAEFRERYGEIRGEKLQIRTGDDGACIFFRKGEGCIVHDGKPDVCRAWPFFRGNIVDPIAFAMARDYCPGIDKNVSHEEFARAGRDYLKRHGLLASDTEKEGRAVILD